MLRTPSENNTSPLSFCERVEAVNVNAITINHDLQNRVLKDNCVVVTLPNTSLQSVAAKQSGSVSIAIMQKKSS
jgi:hypothetical protein